MLPVESLGRTATEGRWHLNLYRHDHHPEAMATLTPQPRDKSALACFEFASDSYQVEDMETGVELPHPGNVLRFPLKQYDLKAFRMNPSALIRV